MPGRVTIVWVRGKTVAIRVRSRPPSSRARRSSPMMRIAMRLPRVRPVPAEPGPCRGPRAGPCPDPWRGLYQVLDTNPTRPVGPDRDGAAGTGRTGGWTTFGGVREKVAFALLTPVQFSALQGRGTIHES